MEKVQKDRTLRLNFLFKVDSQARKVDLVKGVLSDFALGVYHWLSPPPMGIMLQLGAESLVALIATVKSAQGTRNEDASAYLLPHGDA